MKKKFIPIILLIICLCMYINLSGYERNLYAQAVSSSTKRYVNPIGRTVGLKLYTNGVLVVGMSEIDGEDGIKYMPYKESGIKEGDMTKLRASYVCENALFEYSKDLQLSKYIKVGHGEEIDGGRYKKVILALKSSTKTSSTL